MTEQPRENGASPYETNWRAVQRDASDFAAWSRLLAIVEEEAKAHPERVAPCFEGFLAMYPLCFGYWIKYAELAPASAGAIYEHGVAAVPLSVDLWKSYCGFVKDPQSLRTIFERAVRAVGRDARASGLWDAYLAFEAEHGTPETVCSVYRKMLASDARSDELWRKFKVLSQCYKASELVTGDEARGLLQRANYDGGPGDFAEQKQLEQMLKEAETAKNELIQRRLQRQGFEAGVRRWYFHVKPVDDAQLQNWRDYLRKEMDDGDVDAVAALFERCLIPCALYAEFWIKYASWARAAVSLDKALEIVRRARAFLPKRLDVMEHQALLLEANNEHDAARAVYDHMASVLVGDAAKRASYSVARANFERRRGDSDAAVVAYRLTLDRPDSKCYQGVAAHMARYQARVLRDMNAARRTLDDT